MDLINIGGFYEKNNKDIPKDILSGKYEIHAYNPLYFKWDGDLTNYYIEHYTYETFLEHMINKEIKCGYKLKETKDA